MCDTVYAINVGREYSEKAIITGYNELIKKVDLSYMHEGERVLIKPNLVAPSVYATTSIILLECLVDTLKEKKLIPVIAESAGFEFSTEATLEILGIKSFCERKGIELRNLDDEEYVEINSGNELVPVYLLPKFLQGIDHIINVPRLKGHSLTQVTFSIKNLFGLLHRETRRDIHATDLDYGINYLKKLIKVGFILVDGLWQISNAVYSDAQYRGVLICGDSIDAVDKVCCDIYGVDFRRIKHIYDAGYNYANIRYIQINEITKLVSDERSEESFEKRKRNYQRMYLADKYLSKLLGRSSVPYIHYYLGIRPYIDKRKCVLCGRCKEICPANAIRGKKISSKRCMAVRCMKCEEICEYGAVRRRGFHK